MSARQGGAGGSALGLWWRAGLPQRRVLAAAAGAGLLSSICAIGLLATSGWLITRASERPPILDLAVAIGAVQAFALGRGVSRYAQRLAVHGLALEALARLRVWLFDTVEPLVPRGLRDHGAGEAALETGRAPGTGALLHSLVADTETITEAVARSVIAATDVAASVALGTALAWLLDPGAAAALLAAATLSVVLSTLAVRLGRAGAESALQARARLADSVIEAVRSAPELTAFGRRDLVEGRLDPVHRQARHAAFREALSGGGARLAATWAGGAGLLGVVLAGLSLHAGGHLSGVGLAVLVLASLAVLDLCAGLPAALAGLSGGDAAAGRVARLAAIQPPATEPELDHGPTAGPIGAALHDVELWETPASNPILMDVCLEVPEHKRVALVGPSGAGKSSVLHLLLHFLEPSRGAATLGGVDVREMTRAGIARRVAWLDEETHVFAASLGDNLRLSWPEASDAECREALERVGLGRWYAALAEGLQTRLGAGGRPLSAGERQRLGMARALLCQAPVLLLDEPTSHLDPASAPDALRELLGAAGARSVLLVCHEPESAAGVDAVVHLEPGQRAR